MLFSPLNFAVLFVYLGAMIGIGIYFARRQKNTEDFFLAGRKMPWLIVAMSMYASLTSAMTFMGIPHMAYREGVTLIVVCVVSPLLAPLLIWVFYPFYQRLRVTTSYEYIGERFGFAARQAVSGLFVLARLGWLGMVVYAPAMALSAATGLPDWATILLMGVIATVYTVLGGASADIWSDALQFFIMISGAVWILITLVQGVPDGMAGIIRIADEAGRFNLFKGGVNLFEMTTLVVAVCFFLQMMQEYGTDQTTVQRLMATPKLKGISKAIFFNAVVDFVIIGLLLFIGIGLFAYYQTNSDLLKESMLGPKLLPFYIVRTLPDGVSGLLITALFAAAMSSMDSGISSLATVVIHDFVRPRRKKEASEKDDLALGRALTFGFGAAATLAAFYVSTFEHLVDAYTSIMGLFGGPILALFLLGIISTRANFLAWVVAAYVAFLGTLWLQYVIGAHWTFRFPYSFGVSFILGYVGSLIFPKKPVRPDLVLWTRSRSAWLFRNSS